jgi:Cu+-exporting ATPase
MVGTGRGAEAGILIRGGEALETAHKVDAVVLDKTGTLTLGRPVVDEVVAADGFEVREVIDLAASAEKGSEHPLAAAIVARARRDELGFRPIDGFATAVGGGVGATVVSDDGPRDILVGSARWLRERGVDLDVFQDAAARGAEDGRTMAFVVIDGRAAGVITITDPVRDDAPAGVAALEGERVETWLATGDGRATAEAVGRAVGIPPERILADARPADKTDLIERLRAEGRTVAMVGDGLNDAPALAAADLGVAIGTGADVAIEASDVTLVGGDTRAIARAIELSRATMTVIRQNLFWAFAYNVLLIPVAAGVLYPAFGITLNPALAAGAMAFSSVAVVLNSLRLRGHRRAA